MKELTFSHLIHHLAVTELNDSHLAGGVPQKSLGKASMTGFVQLRETRKTWEKELFEKKSGKTWKTQGILRPFLQPQGKLREFYSAKHL